MVYRAVVHPGVPRWAATSLTGTGWLARTAHSSGGAPWLRPFVGALGVVGGIGVVKALTVAPTLAALGGGLALLAPGVIVGGAYVASRGAARLGRRYRDQAYSADELAGAAAADPAFGDAVRRVQLAAEELCASRAWRDGWLPVTSYDVAAANWRATELAWRTHRLRRQIADSSPLVARERTTQLTAEADELAEAVSDLESAAALATQVGGLLPTIGSVRTIARTRARTPAPAFGSGGPLAPAVASVLELLGDRPP